MNVPKKSPMINNGWMLCPSKTFPGKFYYFNVASGEAVWCLNNNETTALKKDNSINIQNINNRFHGYPEPTTPPDDIPNVSLTNSWPNTSTLNPWSRFRRPHIQHDNFTHQTPTLNATWSQCKPTPFQNDKIAQQTAIFGQPAHFVTNPTQYIPNMQNVGMPNLVWTPMQLPMTSGWPYLSSDIKPSVDRVTQTPQIEREMFVHTSGVPLSQKFINYEKPSLYFNKENKIIKNPNHLALSTPLKDSNSEIYSFGNQVPTSKSIPEQVLNMETEIPISNVTEKTPLHTSDRVEICNYNSRYGNNKKSTLSPCGRVKFPKPMWVKEEPQMEDTKILQASDLRLLLNAKRRKIQEEKMADEVEKKKPKIELRSPKKRVTFDLGNNNDTPFTMRTKQEKHYQNISPSTTKCRTSYYKIPVSTAQSTLNYHNIHENKISKTDNDKDSTIMPRNMPRENIPSQNSATNMPTQNIQANNFDIHSHMTLKERNIRPMNEVTLNTMNNMSIEKCHTMDTNKTVINTKENTQRRPFSSTVVETTKSIPTMPTKNITKSMPNENANEAANTSTSFTVRDVWYLIADIDVMLDDLLLIDRLLQSDEKCRLIIPHCVHTELKALCIGDCRGQQRVLVARQLSRRMSMPHKQYILEPPPAEDTYLMTTDAILDSCVRVQKQQHCVILITNDLHLKNKAKALHIRCYNTEEIRNGAILQPKLFSELKKIKVSVDNDIDKNDNFAQNPDSIPVDTYKNQLFVKDEKIDKNCDILINITKPGMDNRFSKCDEYEINNRVQLLHLDDSANSNEFGNKSSFLTKSMTDGNGYEITKSQEMQNASVSHTYITENVRATKQASNTLNAKLIPNTKSDSIVHNKIIKPPKHFQTNLPQSGKSTFDSTPKEKHCLLHISDGINNCPIANDDKTTSSQVVEIDKVTTAGPLIDKSGSPPNPKSSNKNPKNTKDSILNLNSNEKFKIPKLPPSKKEKTITSALNECSETTDNIRTNVKNCDQPLEGRLNKFCVKNKMMQEKLKTKMEEWTCTFTQIIEYLLNDILQNNSKYLKQMVVSNTSLHEMLTCIKMLYDDKRLRDILKILDDLLNKWTCSKGKIKLDITPKDFMKMIGCGVLLVQALKTIFPDIHVLDYYESLLNSLISNIESKTIDLDPELLRTTTTVCWSEIDKPNKVNKHNYTKNSLMIIEYLKKHYKAWSTYDEKQDGEYIQSNNTPNRDYNILRLSGKNINMLKIDSNKSISYIKTTKNNDSILQKDAVTKLVRLLDKNQTNQDLTNADLDIHGKEGRQRTIVSKAQSIFSVESESEINNADEKENVSNLKTNAKEGPKMIRFIGNRNQNSDDKEKQQTFFKTNDDNTRAKIIRKINMIDKYKKRIRSKEPLDLDMLDYSAINDSTSGASSIKSNENDEYHLANSDICNFANDDIDYDNYKCFSNTSLPSTVEVINLNTINNDDNGLRYKDVDLTEDNNKSTKSLTKIEHQSRKADNIKQIDTLKKDNYQNDKVTIENNKNDNYQQDNYKKHPPRDDSTNDSGFENEVTQAHTLVKIFFSELSNTFRVLYKFIIDFIKEIREKVLCDERKHFLHLTSSQRLQAILAVIKQLKCIIERESSEDTSFRSTLLSYGAQSNKDPKITRYRQLIKKCLGQAEILHGALKIIVCTTIGDLDTVSTNAESISSSIKYLTI